MVVAGREEVVIKRTDDAVEVFSQTFATGLADANHLGVLEVLRGSPDPTVHQRKRHRRRGNGGWGAFASAPSMDVSADISARRPVPRRW